MPDSDHEQQAAFVTDETSSGERLDAFLAKQLPQFSRVQLRRAITAGEVLVDNRPAKPAYRLHAEQTISVILPRREAMRRLRQRASSVARGGPSSPRVRNPSQSRCLRRPRSARCSAGTRQSSRSRGSRGCPAVPQGACSSHVAGCASATPCRWVWCHAAQHHTRTP